MNGKPQTTDFRAGYEAGKRDAIDRCLMERVPRTEQPWWLSVPWTCATLYP